MKAKALRRILKSKGCAGEDLGPGLLRSIERDPERCLGPGWLKKS